jgi:hypothetical protein
MNSLGAGLARRLLNARAAIKVQPTDTSRCNNNVLNKTEMSPSNMRLNFMSAKGRLLQTRFRAQTRFEVSPIVTAPFRGPVETRLEQLKHSLLQCVLHDTRHSELHSRLYWAAQEAAGLAWLTPFPLLMFPTLFEEKVRAARKHWLKQQKIRRGPQLPFALAA